MLLLKELLQLKEIIKAIEKHRSSAVKSNAPFISCVSKINNTFIDNAEDLDIVIPMYNLSIARIIKKHQEVYAITTGIN